MPTDARARPFVELADTLFAIERDAASLSAASREGRAGGMISGVVLNDSDDSGLRSVEVLYYLFPEFRAEREDVFGRVRVDTDDDVAQVVGKRSVIRV